MPFVDISVKENDRRTTSYSTYHTAYDNYAYTEQFVDPEWKGKFFMEKLKIKKIKPLKW